MKKLTFFALAVVNMIAVTISSAQVKLPSVDFEKKEPTVLYRTTEDQMVSLTIRFTPGSDEKTNHTAVVKISQDGNGTPMYEMKPSPWKITFGTGYPGEQVIKIAIKTDTSIKFPSLIRVNLLLDNEQIPSSIHNIFYQPSSDAKPTKEEKFIKTAEDVRSDLNTLKTQLLNGDTSKTYIGKLIIMKSAKVVNANGSGIRDKKALEELLHKSAAPAMQKDLHSGNNVYRTTVTDNRDATNIKTISIDRKNIDSVVVRISEGLIEYIRVKMSDDSYYINNRAPIPLLNIERRFTDKLINPLDDSFIFVKEVINLVVDQRFNYIPSDGTFYLTNNSKHPKTEQKLYTSTGLNSYVDFRIFTDLLGALDNQANGLLQIEAKSKIYLHRHNINNSFMYALSAMEPYMGLSKLDSKYDTVKLNNVTKSINRTNLFQRSFLNVGLKLNLYKWDFRPSNSFFVNLGYQFNSSNISMRDNLNKTDSIVSKAIFHTPYAEIGIISKRMAGFGFEGSARFMRQLLNQNQHFINSGYADLMDFNVTAFYYVGKMPRDKFFVRFSNTLNFDDRSEDFYQLQFGYSLSIKL